VGVAAKIEMVHGGGLGIGPDNSCHITSQTCQKKTGHLKDERFRSRLHIQEKENPTNDGYEQAAQKPQKAALVSDNQKHEFPDNADDDSDNQ
jgi:hypothetical protein